LLIKENVLLPSQSATQLAKIELLKYRTLSMYVATRCAAQNASCVKMLQNAPVQRHQKSNWRCVQQEKHQPVRRNKNAE